MIIMKLSTNNSLLRLFLGGVWGWGEISFPLIMNYEINPPPPFSPLLIRYLRSLWRTYLFNVISIWNICLLAQNPRLALYVHKHRHSKNAAQHWPIPNIFSPTIATAKNLQWQSVSVLWVIVHYFREFLEQILFLLR